MENKRKFLYKRGTDYSVVVEYDESTGRMMFSELKVPDSTDHEIKDLFLDEAEIATLEQITE